MTDALLNHISRYISLPEESAGEISVFFTPLSLRKKENLMEAGQVCRNHYFVVKGCLRLFFIDEKGIEQTIQFALENWWLADYTSFSNQKPSAFFIQAIEKSEVLAIDVHAQERMLQQFPVLERYFRIIHQRAHAAAQYRQQYTHDMTREEMYLHFAQSYPEFVQRVPQYLLASFLGFTPEYLSEIRSRNRS
ncbi:Crp/Fnr family transcriptional regulator [Arsenicibacter rosenii]|uniref:Cyclic nucleotide-binding protein n=1 Tax=Arsenicibacter rosenii TaxID=1750698 RepID=A0A1S2VFZ9_9BACT|nr:Crp/Fnr family transcriptional regulator [Arsenicibacter rosenii]OIN56828.1 cyclic nucleotide-binding protein [Arsenicibacter rosenii]